MEVGLAASLAVAGLVIKVLVFPSPPLVTSTTIAGTSESSIIPTCGFQDVHLNPLGCWAEWIGYLPAGYEVAPHYANSPIYPCAPGMSASYCKQFQASCGNGVCDPNESCNVCPID